MSGWTFNEIYTGFGAGRLSSASLASKRVSFLTFSDHRKRSDSPTRRASDDSNGLNQHVPRGTCDEQPECTPHAVSGPDFDRLNAILLRSHFSTLFRLLADRDHIDSGTAERLIAIMNRPDWASARAHMWMLHYATYMRRHDLTEFVENLVVFV